MIHMILAILAIALIGLLFAGLCLATAKLFTHDLAANIAEGTHANGVLTKRADAAHSARHLLVKEGSDDAHIAVSAADEEPLGVCPDTPAAAEDLAAIYLLGVYPNTVKMVGSEAIDAGADVYTAAGGKVQDEPGSAGTYYLVGKAVSDCSGNNGEVEVAPCKPTKLVVVAALTSTNGTAAAASANLANLAAEAEKIGDDVRAIGAALATPALVKVLSA